MDIRYKKLKRKHVNKNHLMNLLFQSTFILKLKVFFQFIRNDNIQKGTIETFVNTYVCAYRAHTENIPSYPLVVFHPYT